MTNPLSTADLDAIRARLERYMQFVDASLSRDAVEDRIKAFDKATGMGCLFARDTDLLLAHADQQQARIEVLEAFAHIVIGMSERTKEDRNSEGYAKGVAETLFTLEYDARQALKGGE